MAKKAAAKTKTKTKTKVKSKVKTKAKLKSGKREANKEKNKERILKAALELFQKKGFYKTTTKEISKRAKIAEGTLFNYFKTKEDLALYFFDRKIQDCIEWYYQDEYVQSAPLNEKLFAITQHNLDEIAPYEEFIGAVYFRALQPDSKLNPLSLDVQELRLKEMKFVRDILSVAEEKGEIPPVGDFGAYALGLAYIGLLTYWLNDRSEGKENTIALLDRALEIGTHIIKSGKWDW